MEEYRVFKSKDRIKWHPLFERLQGTPARLRDRVNSLSPYFFTISLDERNTLLEMVGDLITKESWWTYELNKINEANGEISLHRENFNAKSMVVLLREFGIARMEIISQLNESYKYFGKLGLETSGASIYDLGLTIAENDDLMLSSITKLIEELNKSSMRIFDEKVSLPHEASQVN